MNEPLDEQYLTWLYSQVAPVKARNPSRTYWELLRQMYKKEFVWFIPNDDNRVQDGKDLRNEFRDWYGYSRIEDAWMNLGCSMLEMLMGLANQLSFVGDGRPVDWFWELLRNLELDTYSDREYDNPRTTEQVDNILDRVIWRTYSPHGRGGLFPLLEASTDQRKVELWYQLNSYLLERA